jgi:D-glycero-alpha-D-manno-heptose 1-phosphate guanylyltransferase
VTTAIILAGGLGTRLRTAVPDLPKPMAPILSRPFLEHLMDYWIGQGVNNFVLSVGYLQEVITGHFGQNYRGNSIRYVVEETPLGTGGGLLLAAQGITDPFLVLNGDTFIEVNFKELEKFHREHHAGWTFCLFRTNQLDRYMGMDLKDTGQVRSLKSETSGEDCLANGGVYLVDPLLIAKLNYQKDKKISLEDELLVDYMASGGALYGMECKGKFIDIGIPEDYRRAEKIIPVAK